MSTFEYKGEATKEDWDEFMKLLNDPKRQAEQLRQEKQFYEDLFNTPTMRKAVDEYIKSLETTKDTDTGTKP